MSTRSSRMAVSGPAVMTETAEREVIDLSVVVPLHNEQENVLPLYEELSQVLAGAAPGSGLASGAGGGAAEALACEIIFVNDGSWDYTADRLAEIAARDPKVTVVTFTRCYGQTAALAAGFKLARGRVLVAMDGDLQNDPKDIPALLAKLDQPPGYDVVSGWRKDRKDSWLRTRVSRAANWLIGHITGVRLHDYGCTLKAYRAAMIRDARL